MSKVTEQKAVEFPVKSNKFNAVFKLDDKAKAINDVVAEIKKGKLVIMSIRTGKVCEIVEVKADYTTYRRVDAKRSKKIKSNQIFKFLKDAPAPKPEAKEDAKK